MALLSFRIIYSEGLSLFDTLPYAHVSVCAFVALILAFGNPRSSMRHHTPPNNTPPQLCIHVSLTRIYCKLSSIHEDISSTVSTHKSHTHHHKLFIKLTIAPLSSLSTFRALGIVLTHPWDSSPTTIAINRGAERARKCGRMSSDSEPSR